MKKYKKHIGLVVTKPPVYSEQFIKDKIDGLIANGYRVTLFSNDYIHSNIPCEVRYAFGKQPTSYFILNLLTYLIQGLSHLHILYKYYKLSRANGINRFESIKYLFSNFHILTCEIDFLHFEFSVLAYNRELVAQAIGCPMGISIRGYDIAISPLKNKLLFESIWKHTNKVHTISDDITLLAKQNGMPDQMPVTKINPAIHTEKFKLKDQLGTLHNPIRLISVGRLTWKKGYNYILLALKELQQMNVKFEYQIVGAGKSKEELVYLSHILGISEHIRFMGEIKHDDISELLKQSDIFIQFSTQEGFSNAVLEAQCSGLLVITSDAEGLRENVIDNKTGWIVKSRDYISLAQKIFDVTQMNETERKQIVLYASERVREQFTIDKQKSQFDAFYGN